MNLPLEAEYSIMELLRLHPTVAALIIYCAWPSTQIWSREANSILISCTFFIEFESFEWMHKCNTCPIDGPLC